jgi:hypothetical protein
MGDGPQKRIHDALRVAGEFGGYEGEHHKQWVIDQMVRALTGWQPNFSNRPGYSFEYDAWVAQWQAEEYGPGSGAMWDEGIEP